MKNIVFDYGNVLIYWRPRHILADMGYSEENINLLQPAIFEPTVWEPNDAGLMSAEEYGRAAEERLPERLRGEVMKVMKDWFFHLPHVPGMEALIRELKARGYGIYLVSNIAREFAQHTDMVPAHECFDGMILSGVEGTVKPGREIFNRLLERYSLDAAECLFIDDRQANLDSAAECGISGYLFDGDAEKLKNYIIK